MKIYPKNDKRRLYWLVDLYLAGEIDEDTFCDEFYYSYDLEINTETLSDIEKKTFKELGMVAERFNSFESDFMAAPGAFTNKKELKEAIAKAKKI